MAERITVDPAEVERRRETIKSRWTSDERASRNVPARGETDKRYKLHGNFKQTQKSHWV